MPVETRLQKSKTPQSQPSQPDVTLRCIFIHPDAVIFQSFSIDLTQAEYREDLAKAVVLNRFVDAVKDNVGLAVKGYAIEFYKVTNNDRLNENSVDDIPLLKDVGQRLQKAFSLQKQLGESDSLSDEVLHLALGLRNESKLIPADEGEAEDTLSALPENARFIRARNTLEALPSPSTGSKSSEYSITQARSHTAVCDGVVSHLHLNTTKPTIAPPIHIFHEVFQQFTRDANDREAPLKPSFLKEVLTFMKNAAELRVEDENQSNERIRAELARILGCTITSEPNADKTCADILRAINLLLDNQPIRFLSLLGEIKRAHGEGHNDVSIQATNSWRKTILQSTRRVVVEICCCPAFLIGIAGPWLVVLGAVFTDRFIVQRLTHMVWIAPSNTHDDRRIREVGQVLHALKNGIKTLDNFYSDLMTSPPPPFKPDEPHPRNFPYIKSYTPEGGRPCTFRYLRALEEDDPRCIAYLAEIVEDEKPTEEKVVVKFVETYGREVHEFLANEGHAPKLRYFGRLPQSGGGPLLPSYGAEGSIAPATEMMMVVMDFVEGKSPKSLTSDSSKRLEAILIKLHQQGFVFGDLRLPNIIINDQGEVKLIDFDWAGRYERTEGGPDSQDSSPPPGLAYYPISMSTGLFKHVEGAGPLCPIRPQHDLDMLHKLSENL